MASKRCAAGLLDRQFKNRAVELLALGLSRDLVRVVETGKDLVELALGNRIVLVVVAACIPQRETQEDRPGGGYSYRQPASFSILHRNQCRPRSWAEYCDQIWSQSVDRL